MSSRGMRLGGSSEMTARVVVPSGTMEYALEKKSQLQGSEGSSWSCEVSSGAAAGPLGVAPIHPGQEATRSEPKPKTMKSREPPGYLTRAGAAAEAPKL
jgi:hypothetical protein